MAARSEKTSDADDVIFTPLFTDDAKNAYSVREAFNDIHHSEAGTGAKDEEKLKFELLMAEFERALLEDGDNKNEGVGDTNHKPSGRFEESDQFDWVGLDKYLQKLSHSEDVFGAKNDEPSLQLGEKSEDQLERAVFDDRENISTDMGVTSDNRYEVHGQPKLFDWCNIDNNWHTLPSITKTSETSPTPTGEKNDDLLLKKYEFEQLKAEAERAVLDDRDYMSWDAGGRNDEPSLQFGDSDRGLCDALEVEFPGIYNICSVDNHWYNLPDLGDNSETYPISVGDNMNTRNIPDSRATTSIGDNYTLGPTNGFVDNLALSDPLLSSNDHVLLPHDYTQSSQALEIQNVLEYYIEQGGSVEQQSQREHRYGSDGIFVAANQSGVAAEQRMNKGRWTKEEHGLFIEGLKKHGKGKWKAIASIVGTRTGSQVGTHAQKYYNAMKISQTNAISSEIYNGHLKDFPEDDETLLQEFKRRRIREDDSSRSVKTGYRPDNNGSVFNNRPQLVHISAAQNGGGVLREQHSLFGAKHYVQLHQPQGHQAVASLPHQQPAAPSNPLPHHASMALTSTTLAVV